MIGLLIATCCVACGGSGGAPSVTLEIVALEAATEAGATTEFRVRVLNSDGEPAKDFRGTVRFTSSDAAAVFVAQPTGDGSELTVPVEFRTTGTQTLVVVRGSSEATASVVVTPGAASAFHGGAVPRLLAAGSDVRPIAPALQMLWPVRRGAIRPNARRSAVSLAPPLKQQVNLEPY